MAIAVPGNEKVKERCGQLFSFFFFFEREWSVVFCLITLVTVKLSTDQVCNKSGNQTSKL